jgi:hypothetical protein
MAKSNRTMHEFRALTLFAQKKYDEAAAAKLTPKDTLSALLADALEKQVEH